MGLMVEPDFSEASLLEPGVYVCKVNSVEHRMSKQGRPYLNWKLETGTGVWVYMSTGLSGKGAQKLKALVRATKYPNYANGPIDAHEIVGSFVKAQIAKQIMPDGTEGKYFEVIEVSPVSDSDFQTETEDDLPF